MWIPGVLSPETVQWCAEHKYPYIGLGTANNFNRNVPQLQSVRHQANRPCRLENLRLSTQ